MRIQPHTSVFRHLIGTETEAQTWLQKLQEEPFEDVIHAFHLAEYPEPARGPIDKEPLPNGPLKPVATCPKTGREIHLYFFRDLSCVFIRKGLDAGWDVLPAALSITSEIHDKCLKDIHYNDRYAKVPRLRIQAKPEGLRWRLIAGAASNSEAEPVEMDNADVSKIFSDEMAQAVESILEAPPLADPRVHPNPPEGSRYAPFAVWPKISQADPHIATAKEVVRSLAALHAARVGVPELNIQVMRQRPGTPWRQDNRTPQVIIWPKHGNLSRVIREALDDPTLGFPTALLHGSNNEPLFSVNSIEPATSRHAQLAAHKVLTNALASKSWQDAYKPNAQ